MAGFGALLRRGERLVRVKAVGSVVRGGWDRGGSPAQAG